MRCGGFGEARQQRRFERPQLRGIDRVGSIHLKDELAQDQAPVAVSLLDADHAAVLIALARSSTRTRVPAMLQMRQSVPHLSFQHGL